jgi:hypothetical protein
MKANHDNSLKYFTNKKLEENYLNDDTLRNGKETNSKSNSAL